jgi:hypothetical protein
MNRTDILCAILSLAVVMSAMLFFDFPVITSVNSLRITFLLPIMLILN